MEIGNGNIGQTILYEVDKQITLKYKKEKKSSRTYIYGLEDFMEQKEIEKICKLLKKNLGTGLHITEEEGKNIYGFQGNFIDKISEFLISKGIDSSKIKK